MSVGCFAPQSWCDNWNSIEPAMSFWWLCLGIVVLAVTGRALKHLREFISDVVGNATTEAQKRANSIRKTVHDFVYHHNRDFDVVTLGQKYYPITQECPRRTAVYGTYPDGIILAEKPLYGVLVDKASGITVYGPHNDEAERVTYDEESAAHLGEEQPYLTPGLLLDFETIVSIRSDLDTNEYTGRRTLVINKPWMKAFAAIVLVERHRIKDHEVRRRTGGKRGGDDVNLDWCSIQTREVPNWRYFVWKYEQPTKSVMVTMKRLQRAHWMLYGGARIVTRPLLVTWRNVYARIIHWMKEHR